MLTVAAVHLDHLGFVAVGVGIYARATERLGPVCREPLYMLGMEAVAEGMGNHVVSQHSTMPGVGKTAQALHSTGCFEYSLHPLIMTIVPSLGKTTTARRETGLLT